MRILIAEDEPVSRRILERTLVSWGHEVVITHDGAQAWAALREADAPPLAILDWMMPGMDGPEVCRRVRGGQSAMPTYIILLTGKGEKGDVAEALSAGANDYLTKPFDRAELQARVHVGAAVAGLQRRLAERDAELEEALAHVRLLQGAPPPCPHCTQVRDDRDGWQSVEGHIGEHAGAKFGQGIGPDCYEAVVKPRLDEPKGGRVAAETATLTW